MPNKKSLHMLAYASSIAGAKSGSEKGPETIQHSSYLSMLTDQNIYLKWDAIFKPDVARNTILAKVSHLCAQLAEVTAQLTKQKKMFVVLGGDHTSAIGTWSGVADAKKPEGPIGLIWVDAHMDSHTQQTSETGNLHGMPLACLLGQGDDSLTQLCDFSPKLNPENICLVGVRSFEKGESELLEKLNVRVFYMDEIRKRGLTDVMQEAIKIVSRNTVGYGLSIDLDSIDPVDAPGTGVPELNGLMAQELCKALTLFSEDPRLLGVEIVEFDPDYDVEKKTEKLIFQLILSLQSFCHPRES